MRKLYIVQFSPAFPMYLRTETIFQIECNQTSCFSLCVHAHTPYLGGLSKDFCSNFLITIRKRRFKVYLFDGCCYTLYLNLKNFSLTAVIFRNLSCYFFRWWWQMTSFQGFSHLNKSSKIMWKNLTGKLALACQIWIYCIRLKENVQKHPKIAVFWKCSVFDGFWTFLFKRRQ